MSKSESYLRVLEYQVKKRVQHIFDNDVDEIIKELEEINFDGDIQLAALEIVGSIGATIQNHITKVINDKGNIAVQKPVKDMLSDAN